MARPSSILKRYAAFLVVAGLAGFALSGFSAKAKTSIIMGCSTGALVALSAWLAGREGTASLGARLGTLLSAVFAAVFAWRCSLALPVPEKLYLAVLLGAMCAGSLHTTYSLLRGGKGKEGKEGKEKPAEAKSS